MRIITGIYKGRHFDIPRSFKARPTTDFAKENIFNVLTQYIDFDGALALDLFSGTGSISLELVSRGCRKVVSIEADRDHHRFICDCLAKLDTAVCRPIRGDVFRYLKSGRRQLLSGEDEKTGFDFVFADPPYALRELSTLPTLIFEKQLLAPDGIFLLEHGKDHDFSQHPNFVEHRAYGSVNFSLFRYTT